MSAEGSEGNSATNALAELQRELRAIQQGNHGNEPVDNEPPIAELESLANALTKLKAVGPVPFDRVRTWETIANRLDLEVD